MSRGPRQPSLPFRGKPIGKRRHGGRREGAGRPKMRDGHWVAHAPRAWVDPRAPLHVTVRMVPGAPRLRRGAAAREIRHAMIGAQNRTAGFRICHYSVQSNHVHLIVEAADRARLARGMQSFGIRTARRLNLRAGRRGRLWRDRYHAVPLRTPAQVRNAIAYVLANARRHGVFEARQRGWLDPFSSAHDFDGWQHRRPRTRDPYAATAPPRTWLLARGWRRGGLIPVDVAPGPRPAASG